MSDNTNIEWTDATWNPIVGCSRVSTGCMNCYAERQAHRFSGLEGSVYFGTTRKVNGHPAWTGRVNLSGMRVMVQPLIWKKPRRIFVNSMSDLFHENLPDATIDCIFAVMMLAPQHTFQVLTKRPQRMLDYLSAPERWASIVLAAGHMAGVESREGRSWNVKLLLDAWNAQLTRTTGGCLPLPNVWLGVSVENQETADERIPTLLQCPAAVRWISAEPLLGRVDLCEFFGIWWNSTMDCWESTGAEINRLYNGVGCLGQKLIDWVVVGGESGPGARPMHPDWARSLRDQCAGAGVPFLFKQWGAWYPDRKGIYRNAESAIFGDTVVHRLGKKAAGRLLDGVLHDGYPEEQL